MSCDVMARVGDVVIDNEWGEEENRDSEVEKRVIVGSPVPNSFLQDGSLSPDTGNNKPDDVRLTLNQINCGRNY